VTDGSPQLRGQVGCGCLPPLQCAACCAVVLLLYMLNRGRRVCAALGRTHERLVVDAVGACCPMQLASSQLQDLVKGRESICGVS